MTKRRLSFLSFSIVLARVMYEPGSAVEWLPILLITILLPALVINAVLISVYVINKKVLNRIQIAMIHNISSIDFPHFDMFINQIYILRSTTTHLIWRI